MKKFIIVFNEIDRDKLIVEEFKLIKSNEGFYVFENKEHKKKLFNKINYAQTDTLRFC